MNRLVACRSAVLAGCVLLAGCSGNGLLTSDRPPLDTYRLAYAGAATGAAGAPAAASSLPLALVVARPRAATALDTDRIATVIEDGGRFDYYAGVRWAEPAPQMVQQQLVAALSGGGTFGGGVFAAPARVPAELMLDVELRRFEAVTASPAGTGHGGAPTVYVQVQASLVDSRKAARVTSFVSSAQVAAAENRRAAIIAAFERATSQVVADVTQRVQASASSLR
jgi:cholesterol transport system auxiliary component